MTKNILSEINACTLCENSLPHRAKPVLQFNTNSKILIAGQAPGLAAHNNAKPFADVSGDRLRRWLNISNEQFYDAANFAIVPMGFCYPGKAQSGDLPPEKRCAQTWRKPLLSTLNQCQLTIILGKYAAKWHLSCDLSITSLCLQWQELLAQNIIVLPHPSPRNTPWLKKHPWFEQTLVPVLQARVSKILVE